MQLQLSFIDSKVQKTKSSKASKNELQLFTPQLNVDVYLHNQEYAIGQIIGKDVDMSIFLFEKIVGKVIRLRNKRVMFSVRYLDRLIDFRNPSKVTLDAATLVIARAIWASKLGLPPLTIEYSGRRVTGYSRGWPKLFKVKDVSWGSISVIYKLGIEMNYKDDAKRFLLRKFNKNEKTIANAGVNGNTVLIETSYPEALEELNILGLQYAGSRGSGRYKLPILCAVELLKFEQVTLTDELRRKIEKISTVQKPVHQVEGMSRKLYPFQAIDVAKASKILESTGSVLMAGEMGSGKTTMTIALLFIHNTWPALVVSPLSAFKTWQTELSETGKTVYLATGPTSEVWESIVKGGFDSVLVSYDRIHVFQEAIEQGNFKCIVADEVQRIRTPGSRRSRAMRSLSSSTQYRIGLSGTPITNSISDILPIGSFLSPTEWKPRSSQKDLSDIYPGDTEASLSSHINSIMVRRRMTDVGAKLPKRNDHRVYVDLTAEQEEEVMQLQTKVKIQGKEGFFSEKKNKIHAFAKLQHMRKIINSPESVGIETGNPKSEAALSLVKDFVALDRKGVLFCADRATFKLLGNGLTELGIKWVGIWGATPVEDRIANEKTFHSDPETKVVLCTIQAGSESWSASPSATWLISTSYMYSPSMLSQMESRVYRMNSDPDGYDIEIIYIHARSKGGTLDDRMVEILERKKEMFSKIVDRSNFKDSTNEHYTMEDLEYLLTGKPLKVAKNRTSRTV